MAALTDPLSLFADRSPGGRGGALLSTKPERTAALIPEERVLSGVRDRDPGAGAPAPPALNDPLFAAAAPGGGDGIPGAGSSSGEAGLPGGGAGGPDAFAPFGEPFTPGTEPPDFIPGGGNPPAGAPGGPIPSGVPEPAAWAMLIIGFFAVGSVLRRGASARGGKRIVEWDGRT
jgi:hypothetical protein